MAQEQTGPHILVVDDEKIIRELTTEILETAGYRVTSLATGGETLAYAADSANRIDLVILDILMPDYTGHELFHALRRIHPSVRVILMSGYDRDEEIQKLLESGGVMFLQKPIPISSLLEAVETLLRE